MVERLVANEKVEGSIPFARSNYYDGFNKKNVCRVKGSDTFDLSEIHKHQKMVDGWSLIENEKMVFF